VLFLFIYFFIHSFGGRGAVHKLYNAKNGHFMTTPTPYNVIALATVPSRRHPRRWGFLLAKDSLIKSRHASHPIAGQGAAAWCGSAQYESVSNPEKLWANVTKAF